MVGIERHTDQVAQAVIIPVPDKPVHLFRLRIFAIHADIYILIIVE